MNGGEIRRLPLAGHEAVVADDVAVQAGFSSTSHFATWYKRIYGARPSEMRGGAADRRIASAGHRRNRA